MAGRPQVFKDDELLAALRGHKRRTGQVPRMVDFGAEREPGQPSAQTFVHRFGSWANAVEAAGMERPRRGPRKR